MKPRLVSLPLTSEDVMIWRRWRRHVGDPWYGRLRIEYGAADIRDAELMLYAQQIASCGPCGIELYGIAFRGWDQAENGKLRGAL